jgi:hypothetical protein
VGNAATAEGAGARASASRGDANNAYVKGDRSSGSASVGEVNVQVP